MYPKHCGPAMTSCFYFMSSLERWHNTCMELWISWPFSVKPKLPSWEWSSNFLRTAFTQLLAKYENASRSAKFAYITFNLENKTNHWPNILTHSLISQYNVISYFVLSDCFFWIGFFRFFKHTLRLKKFTRLGIQPRGRFLLIYHKNEIMSLLYKHHIRDFWNYHLKQ